MSPLSVESLKEFDQALIDEIGVVLPPTDPQLGLFVEQMQEVGAFTATPSYFFLARRDDRFAGYARARQRVPNGDEWLFDSVLAPQPQEKSEETATALFMCARSEVKMPIIEWWTRGITEVVVANIASRIGLRHERTILRMELDLAETPKLHPLPTRSFALADAAEIVRVNNEAFKGHADRAHLDVSRLMNDFDAGAHKYDDLRVFEDQKGLIAGFVWVKEQFERYGEVFVLALDSAHQGLGYGRSLLDAGIEYLQQTYSPKRAMLYVESTNQRAIDVYVAYGFEDVGQSLVSFCSR